MMSFEKHGRKVIVGTEGGFLDIFDWGNSTEYSDRLVGSKSTIDCLFPLNDSMMLTGSSDGLIRIVNILPNSIVGFLGNHGSDPIECLFVTQDKTRVFSCGHDGFVKLWNLNGFLKREEEEESDYDETEISNSHQKILNFSKNDLCHRKTIYSNESISVTPSTHDVSKSTFNKPSLLNEKRSSSESRFFFQI